jgi:hypothetical protein
MSHTNHLVHLLMPLSLIGAGCAVETPPSTVGAPIDEAANDTGSASTGGDSPAGGDEDRSGGGCEGGCQPPVPTCGDRCGAPITLPDQRVDLQIDVRGTGAFVGPDLGCGLLALVGEFRARYRGTAALTGGELRITSVDTEGATITTASGCRLRGIAVTAATSVEVRAAIAASAPSCSAFCALDAAAEALAACGAGPACAACRAEVEADVRARCAVACPGERHRIVADASLSLDALAALSGCGVTTDSLARADLSLGFDHVVDGDGVTVCD